MKDGWPRVALSELGLAAREPVQAVTTTEYELWSVPSFENDEPETAFGSEIRSAKLSVRPDDVLICKINPRINRVWQVRRPIHGRSQIASAEWLVFRIHPDAGLLPEWLVYFASSPSFREWIESEVSGSTGSHTRARAEGILRRQMPLPPLGEQMRIVAVLDDALSGIDTARENAEKNFRNARAVFESRLQSVFTQHGDGWRVRRLGDLCEKITVGHVGSMATRYQGEGVPFLRSQNIRPFEVVLDNVVFIDGAFHASLSKSQLRPGDVAIVRTGYPGTAAVVPPGLPDSNCADLVIVRPGPEIDPHFLAAFFNSDFGKSMVGGRLVGSAQKHFNVTAAKDVTLHLPPKPTQREIADSIAALRAETRGLESVYHRKLAAVDELRQSLLRAAFAGSL